MTDQCFDDELDRGREPEPVTPGYQLRNLINNHVTTYSGILPSEWYRGGTDTNQAPDPVIRNTAAKLELTKKALEEYVSELHGCADRQLSTTSVYFMIKNILNQLED